MPHCLFGNNSMFSVHRGYLLDFIVRPHEDAGPVVDMFRHNLQHPLLIIRHSKTTGYK